MFFGDVNISVTEQSRKLKFSMQTCLTHINIIFEYCLTSAILDKVDALHLEYWNVSRPVLKKQF